MSKAKSTEGMCKVFYVNTEAVNKISAQMVSEDTLSVMAETFSLLGDPTRLRVVRALSLGELCVCDLASMLGVGRTVISNHLRLLRTMRLVTYRRQGKLAYYSFTDDHIKNLLSECLEHVQEL